MPAYFFHLGFELYPSRSPPGTTYTPPPGTNIFTSALPGHSTSAWSSLSPPPKSYSAAVQSIASSSEAPPPLPKPRRYSQRARLSFSDHRDSPVPLVKPPARPAYRRAKSFAHKDWRFDPISILSIDMLPAGNSGGLATKGTFIPLHPKETDVGWGVVHLYRDGHKTPGLYGDEREGQGTEFSQEDCTTLCILAVPSYMTPSDLLGFVGEQTREHVSHFRLIKTARANKYMVLIKFWEASKAREWRKEWNGKPFNSMEPEYCHVVFIKSITFQSDVSNRDPSSYPDLTNDPFTPAPAEPASNVSSPVESSTITPSLTAKPIAPPTASLVELPTCPVCLERMDETTGLLTILCQHVFHCACLEKWRGSGCPVCRYTQNDAFSSTRSTGDDAPENECSVCGSTQNLWICLICGNIGCGRYDSAHAFAHYETTNHTYAMDVVSQHVWDYAGDGYVHRLIQNKADGKLVDLPASAHAGGLKSAGMTGYANDTVPREKLDNMGVEYAYLLTSQLESQRAYFEEQVERAVDKAAKASNVAEEASRNISALTADFAKLQAQYDESRMALANLEKEAARNAAKAASASDLARKLTKQYKEEQTINESLMQRIKHLEKKAEDAETKVREVEVQKADLEEQNRDLSFFISGQEKLKEMQQNELIGEDDMQSGYVEVGQKEEKGRRKGKGRKK